LNKASRFVAPLTDDEQDALTTVYRDGEQRAQRRRAHAILLSHQGYTIYQICDILEVKRNTVSIWLKNWEATGLAGLKDKPRSGRRPIYDDQDRERLQELVEEHPHQVKTIRARLQEETGKAASIATIKRALKKIGYSFKRVRRSLKRRRNETDFRNTQGLLAELQKWEDQGAAERYYFDESGFSQSSSIPYAWSPIGQPWEMVAYSHSHRLNVLGFLSRQGKLVYHTTTESVTTEAMITAFGKRSFQSVWT